MPNEMLTETSDAVLREYGQFTAPTEEGRQQLAKIRQNVKDWFNSSSRIITNAAALSLEKLVEAEVDHGSKARPGKKRRRAAYGYSLPPCLIWLQPELPLLERIVLWGVSLVGLPIVLRRVWD